MNLEKALRMAGVTVEMIGDELNVPYSRIVRVLKGEMDCPKNIENKIKIFLITNYAKCIESINFNKEA